MSAKNFGKPQSILVIRRDNIGDLVCTTPLFSELRRLYPDARIDALVNSYNAPVLAANPDLDHVYSYTKAKHRALGETALGVHWRRFRMLGELRAVGYDLAILANDGDVPRAAKLARWVKPRHLLGFLRSSEQGKYGIDLPLLCAESSLHAVEVSLSLLGALGHEIPVDCPMTVVPEFSFKARAQERLAACAWYHPERPLLAIHISARKVPQRWPVEKFAELLQRLNAMYEAQFVIFWSPGDENNPLHPGDDRKAAALLAACSDLPVLAFPTAELEELIGGLSLCDSMICSDGGAMHIAAALGKPIVCMFGNSDTVRWRPWGVPYELLQKPSRVVAEIVVDEVIEAFARLFKRTVTTG